MRNSEFGIARERFIKTDPAQWHEHRCKCEGGDPWTEQAGFYAKLNIALKEASETEYWLELLHESEYIEPNAFQSIYADCQEIIRLLVAITKTQKTQK